MDIFLKKKSVLWQRILVGVFALLFFILALNVLSGPIRNSFYYLTSPITGSFRKMGAGISGFFGSFFQSQILQQENTALNKENQTLLAEVSSLQEIIKQDQSIKEVVENTAADNFNLASAQVIGLDPSLDYMLIDKGTSNGVFVNMPVISDQKVLYGRVDKAYKNFSEVMLISSKSSVLDAEVENSDPAQIPVYGAIKGSGNLSVYLDLVSSSATIQEGDVLVTSGLEGTFPKDLLVGKISLKDKNDLKPFQTAQVTPFFDIKSVDTLFVITNYKQTN